MMIFCAKGCGTAIEVSEEVTSEAARNGVPINVAHEVCPTDLPPEEQPTYSVTVTVMRLAPGADDGVMLATSGGVAHAATFDKAYPELTKQLSEQWEKVGQMRHIAEQGLDDPTSES